MDDMRILRFLQTGLAVVLAVAGVTTLGTGASRAEGTLPAPGTSLATTPPGAATGTLEVGYGHA